jgi:steroid delta-isomerase-like uncharacterized protein
MTPDESKAFFHHWNEEVWNHQRLEFVDQLVDPNYYRHDPGIPHEVRGPESLKHLIGMYFTAFPDLHLTAEQVIAEGGMVSVVQTARGTHNGNFMGMLATGKTVEVTVMEMFRLENHRIVEQWVSVDVHGMLRQLGMA